MHPDELQSKLELLHTILAEKWTPQKLDKHPEPGTAGDASLILASHISMAPQRPVRRENSMLWKRPLILVVALVGTSLGVGPQAKGKETDTRARKAVVQFFKAFKAKEIDDLMKAVDVPFCREGGKNVEKRDDLKQFFQQALQVRDPSKDTITIKLVTTLPKLEEAEGKFTDDERKAVEAVLGKDHRVVKVEWDRFGEGKQRMLILVRLQQGKARVVGII